MEIAEILLILAGLVLVGTLAAFGLASLKERERRAAALAFGLAVVASLCLVLTVLLPSPWQWAILAFLAGGVVAGAALFLMPIGRVEVTEPEPQTRHDERDIMFARAHLQLGTPNYVAYYAMRPENKRGDDRTRSLPGLLSSEAREANPPVFAATEATFDLIEVLRPHVDGPVHPQQIAAGGRVTDYLKGLARYWGARSVGVAALRPYHVYSHVGRGASEYGAPVILDHQNALAFSVEMAHDMVATAPAAPTLMESARQYATSTQIAIQLASTIRRLGYAARAHVDGNYQVIAPLVAWDAGLGELGRMGLLMTRDLGPRVRLGVVTTDLPLEPDGRQRDASVLDFCRICKKCADNCPVRAIPFGERNEIDGVLRWRIDHETCYRYWCVTGTDCARCVAVCPYSYPDSPLHDAVRWAAQKSGFARRVALGLDQVLYGAHPKPRAAPDWVPPKPGIKE
ncbi:MAG: 4Fe-4S dicluster domain-containing protein [Anaerolineae bacterium]|jgi:reductive dehalogenase